MNRVPRERTNFLAQTTVTFDRRRTEKVRRFTALRFPDEIISTNTLDTKEVEESLSAAGCITILFSKEGHNETESITQRLQVCAQLICFAERIARTCSAT